MSFAIHDLANLSKRLCEEFGGEQSYFQITLKPKPFMHLWRDMAAIRNPYAKEGLPADPGSFELNFPTGSVTVFLGEK